jgi:hypothetical protein
VPCSPLAFLSHHLISGATPPHCLVRATVGAVGKAKTKQRLSTKVDTGMHCYTDLLLLLLFFFSDFTCFSVRTFGKAKTKQRLPVN